MMAKGLKEWAIIPEKMGFIFRHMVTNNMTLTTVENSMAIYFYILLDMDTAHIWHIGIHENKTLIYTK